MKVEADFSGISSSFEPLEEGEYNFKLIEIQEQANDEEWKAKNDGTDKIPAMVFVSEVLDGERAGAQTFDYVYTKQKDGKVNKVGLGRIKAYAEAILGKEAANSTTGIDTDALPGNAFKGFIKHRSYADKVSGEQKIGASLSKILPAG